MYTRHTYNTHTQICFCLQFHCPGKWGRIVLHCVSNRGHPVPIVIGLGPMILRDCGKRTEFAEFSPRNGKWDLNLKEKTSAILLIKNIIL